MAEYKLAFEFLEIPLRVKVKSKKKVWVSLNLNEYRNAYYRVLNDAKKEIKKMFQEKYGVRKLTDPASEYKLEYTLFFPNNRRVDVSNVGSIIDKFIADALVESGYLVDDDRKHVKEVVFKDGGIDKESPRAELRVYKKEESK